MIKVRIYYVDTNSLESNNNLSTIEIKNEIKLLKICINRCYKSYFTSFKMISDMKNKILNSDKDISKILKSYDDINIPQYEESKMLEDITNSYNEVKEVIIAFIEKKKENLDKQNEINALNAKLDNEKVRVSNLEKNISYLKVLNQKVEAKTKTNINLIFKQINSINMDNSLYFEKTPLFSLMENIFVYLKKSAINYQFKEYLAINKLDKTNSSKIENIMKQAEDGYNQCFERSKSYILFNEVNNLIDKIKTFNSQILDLVMKGFLGYKSNSSNTNELTIKIPIKDFNSFLDKIANNSDSFWKDISKISEEYKPYINKIQDCFSLILDETSVKDNLIESLVNFIEEEKDLAKNNDFESK